MYKNSAKSSKKILKNPSEILKTGKGYINYLNGVPIS